MIDVHWLLLAPMAAGLMAAAAPGLVFAAPPKGGGAQLLKHCRTLSIRGMVTSVLVTAVGIYSAWIGLVSMSTSASMQSVGERLALTLRWELMPVTLYIGLILRVATLRSQDVTAVMGQSAGFGEPVDMARRVLQNTGEQLLAGVLARMILAVCISQQQIAVVPMMTVLWLCGRVLFAMGYTAENPMAREFGFDLTIVSTMACVVISAATILMRG